jgi:CheY-like chemotaxis protein
MIVDDEADILRIIKQWLERWDFEVDIFNDPEKALAHFQQNRALYSLVLTDVRMPAMSGLELAGHMRRLNPTIKIIVMTAYEIEPEELTTTLLHLDWQAVLRKPFTQAEVCSSIRRQLQISP